MDIPGRRPSRDDRRCANVGPIPTLRCNARGTSDALCPEAKMKSLIDSPSRRRRRTCADVPPLLMQSRVAKKSILSSWQYRVDGGEQRGSCSSAYGVIICLMLYVLQHRWPHRPCFRRGTGVVLEISRRGAGCSISDWSVFRAVAFKRKLLATYRLHVTAKLCSSRSTLVRDLS